MSFKLRDLLGSENHLSGRISELDRVAEDVDEDLLELHIIAVVVIAHLSDDVAGVFKALVHTLAVDDDIDLIEELPEGELLVFENHAARFNAAHIENVIDESEQVFCACPDLFQIGPGLRREIRIPQGNVVKTDDRVHRGADLMAHVGEKACLCPAALLRQRLFHFDLLLPLLGIGIDIKENDQRDDNQCRLNEMAQ